MSVGKSFRSVFMVASCAGAALGCYLVSLRVASERAALEDVETSIVMAERDIRVLQTEIGTRGRLAQLERWNVKVLALSAPSADQFLEGGFALAKLARPQETIDPAAPVVLASAPAAETNVLAESGQGGDSAPRSGPASMVHQASLKRVARLDTEVEPAARKPKAAAEAPEPAETKASAAVAKKPVPKSAEKPAPKPQTGVKPASKPLATRPAGTAAKPVDKKSTEKKESAAARPVTKPARLAKADPLAPLPAGKKTMAKDSGSTR